MSRLSIRHHLFSPHFLLDFLLSSEIEKKKKKQRKMAEYSHFVGGGAEILTYIQFVVPVTREISTRFHHFLRGNNNIWILILPLKGFAPGLYVWATV